MAGYRAGHMAGRQVDSKETTPYNNFLKVFLKF